MNQKEYALYLWGGSWVALTWSSYFVVRLYLAVKRRVYQRSRWRNQLP